MISDKPIDDSIADRILPERPSTRESHGATRVLAPAQPSQMFSDHPRLLRPGSPSFGEDERNDVRDQAEDDDAEARRRRRVTHASRRPVYGMAVAKAGF